jgi:c-di-GMP-binding flagellar brake protein YcgR
MTDILSSLDKKTTTLKISFKGEICRIRFIDGVHLNVDSSRFGLRYVAKIENIGDKIISLRFLSPVKEVKNLKGRELDICFSYEKDYYYFSSVIMDHQNEVLLITKPAVVHKEQRREFFRLPISIPVTVKKVYNSKLDVAIFKDYFEQGIVSKDISTGGLRMEKNYISGIVDSGIEFVSSKSIEKNSVVELEVTLPTALRTINAICKVAWIHKVGGKYEIGMRFYEIDPEDLAAVQQYITSGQQQDKPAARKAPAKRPASPRKKRK